MPPRERRAPTTPDTRARSNTRLNFRAIYGYNLLWSSLSYLTLKHTFHRACVGRGYTNNVLTDIFVVQHCAQNLAADHPLCFSPHHNLALPSVSVRPASTSMLRSQRLDLLLGPLGPLESVLERGRAHLARDNAVILANFGGDLARLLCRSLGMVFYTDVRSESQWRRMTMVSPWV
jgi:hypothetical protein